MDRGIMYRRDKLKFKVIKRLRRYALRNYYRYYDPNGIRLEHPQWFDFLGGEYEFKCKNQTTDKWDTQYKRSYSKVRRYNSSHFNTRLKQKIYFKKILEEHGFKHLYPEQ
jgi:hypothetical protein